MHSLLQEGLHSSRKASMFYFLGQKSNVVSLWRQRHSQDTGERKLAEEPSIQPAGDHSSYHSTVEAPTAPPIHLLDLRHSPDPALLRPTYPIVCISVQDATEE